MRTGTLFQKIRNSRSSRIVCAFLALNILGELITPNVALALTAGPSAPEFSSFEPVATTDMVNDFTGDFTYNIPIVNVPGPDGGDYAMSLAYHSGSSSEEEASWVGFGWTLNPGAINRNKRGYPDEFNKVQVETFNKTRPIWNQSVNYNVNVEICSKDGNPDSLVENLAVKAGDIVRKNAGLYQKYKEVGGLQVTHSVNYSNYKGFSISNGINASAKEFGSLSVNRTGRRFSGQVKPWAMLMTWAMKKVTKGKVDEQKITKRTIDKRINDYLYKHHKSSLSGVALGVISSAFSIHNYNVPSPSYSVARYLGMNFEYNYSSKLNITPTPIGFQYGISGSSGLQATIGREVMDAYGYMYSSYSSPNSNNEDCLFDYSMERPTTFDKRDKNVGIPYNNADVFSVSGNQALGGFRFYHDNIGVFYPNYHKNKVRFSRVGAELGIGADLQIGINIGAGFSVTKVSGAWASEDLSYVNTTPELRFMNDPAGEVDYLPSQDYSEAPVIGYVNMGKVTPPVSAIVSPSSSNYGFKIDQTKKDKSASIDYVWGNGNQIPSDAISGMIVKDKTGTKSYYTIPVLTRNEAQLSVGLENNSDGTMIATQPFYYDTPMENKTVIGTKTAKEYANSFLLQKQTTFNYIDANGNGKPDDADFGGWVNFDYQKAYGGAGSNWYRYRTPYNGLRYDAGRLLDVNDQTGSMSSGEKEVYYLKSIQSKTHVAFFVTNTMSAATFTTQYPIADYGYLYHPQTSMPLPTVVAALQGSGKLRYDGLDAAGISGGMDLAAASTTAKGTHALQKLEKIVLFSKSDLTHPLTTTHFEYDYSLCQGILNSSNNAPVGQKGKLTLKRVWTESNGVARSQIAPYVFHYEYFNQYPSELVNHPGYGSMLAGYNLYPTHDANQNPDYKPENLDAWGFYQLNGPQRYANMQTWLSQRAAPAHFDPAAWQLKRIQLPSGGEIHVHYEQKDYLHVQDKQATAMVSLSQAGTQDTYQSDDNTFEINLSDLNLIGPLDIGNYHKTLQNYFIVERNKLYFKFLYAFTGDATPVLNTKNERYEYVTGYTTVNEVQLTGGGTRILLKLGDLRKNFVTSALFGDGKKDKTLPRAVCYDEVLEQGGNNLKSGGSFNPDQDFTGVVYPNTTNASLSTLYTAAQERKFENGFSLFEDAITAKIKNKAAKNVCKQLNYGLSYFKVPVHFAKKGGGVRVKRLLTYDKGIETGDAMIFGSEYVYEGEDGRSSGVATNEPPEMREENALVGYLERKKQRFMDKATRGRETKIMEGPLGENILPAASVSHARVIIKNLHSGKSTTGFVVNEYATCKDYPMEADFTEIKRKLLGGGTLGQFNLSLPLLFLNVDIHHASVTQGYVFRLNDMHGKPKAKAVYAGNYNPLSFNSSGFTSKTIYNYYEPGSKIKTLVFDNATDSFRKEELQPGTEEDYTVYSSVVKEKAFNLKFDADINIVLSDLPKTFFTKAGSFSYTDQILRQYVVTKVLRQVSYLKETVNITDGVVQTTKNLAYDRYTGDPVLTQTFDGYGSENNGIYTEKMTTQRHNGSYYALSIPAYWMYPTMGPVSKNTMYTNQLNGNAGSVVTYSANGLAAFIQSNTLTANWTPATVGYELNNVVSATAVTYTNNWFTAADAQPLAAPGLTNVAVLNTANSFYYPLRSYSYREKVKDANASGSKIYEGGITYSTFNFFDWKGYHATGSPTVAPQWYSDSRVTRYSPYGYPVEETDVLGIKSSAKFGYSNTLPVLVAQNAGYDQTYFNDYEYGVVLGCTTVAAHTGRYSYDYSSNTSYPFVSAYPLTTDIITQRGLTVKFWLRSMLSSQAGSTSLRLKNNAAVIKVDIGGQSFKTELIAQTGEWSLYSAEIRNFGNLTPGQYPVKLVYGPIQGGETVFVDDFRVQPLDASMNCSVYYPDKKLAAQFDDQHFAIVYEYNQKGQLTRKSIETTRGLKTLQEQQYNTPLINR